MCRAADSKQHVGVDVRILQLHTRYRQRGGEDHVVDAEARVLREAGHQVHQLIDHNPESNLGAAGAMIVSPWNRRASQWVRRTVNEFQPDVAHVHNTWFAMSPSVIHGLSKESVPIVMTLHNYRLTCANGLLFRDGAPCELCVGSHPWHAVRYGCYRASRVLSVPAAISIDLHRRLETWSEKVDTFIALTDFQRELMIRAGLPEEKLVVKPNFVSDPGLRPAPPSASNKVLYVGRLSQEKGVDVLLDAWRSAAISGLELVIVGDGPLVDDLKIDIPQDVRFLGRVSRDQVGQLMLTSRAGVFPSRCYEGLPLTILESIAAGLPVAVSDVGSPARVIASALGRNWIFESSSPTSLSQVLHRLADDSWCDSSGDLARALFIASFDEANLATRLVRIYRATISNSGKLATV